MTTSAEAPNLVALSAPVAALASVVADLAAYVGTDIVTLLLVGVAMTQLTMRR